MHRLPFFLEQHRALIERFDAFAREQIDPLAPRDEADTDAAAREYVRRLAAGGWLSFLDPIDIRAATLLRERLGYASALADTMFAMQGLGGLPIALHGSAVQRNDWLPRIAGGAIGAFALTEPDAGSDPAGMKLRAERDGGPVGGRGWRLTGEKTFISNAGLAEVYVVFARTAGFAADSGGNASAGVAGTPIAQTAGGPHESGGPAGAHPDGESRAAHTAFIVPGDSAGLTVEPIELIAPHPIGTLRFNGVVVPDSHRLGAVGDGLKVALGTLDRFRCTVAAAACGMARRALDESIAHVRRREQFGKPLAKFQGVQFMLAEMATELEAAQLLTARAAWMVDGGGENVSAEADDPLSARESPSPQPFGLPPWSPSAFKGEGTGGMAAPAIAPGLARGLSPDSEIKRAVSIAKLYATDHAHAIIDQAVQLHGGGGLVRGATVERLYREIRALRIYEGTSEIQKLVIARTLL